MIITRDRIETEIQNLGLESSYENHNRVEKVLQGMHTDARNECINDIRKLFHGELAGVLGLGDVDRYSLTLAFRAIRELLEFEDEEFSE